MFVVVSTGDCRVAIKAALKDLEAKLASDKEQLRVRSFSHLSEGARHNGLTITPEHDKEMREMVDRDIDHAAQNHPATELLGQLAIYQKMVGYDTDGHMALDPQSFELLHKHLPPR